MLTEEARQLATDLVTSTGKKGTGEPSAKQIAAALGSLIVNVARIADALEERNTAMRNGSWR